MSSQSDLPPETRVDLHIHTTASDGTWTPQQLISRAKQGGLGLIAVTDHYSIENLAETVRIAGEAGIRTVAGVELNVLVEGEVAHLLGYGFDPRNQGLNRMIDAIRAMVVTQNEAVIHWLAGEGRIPGYQNYLDYREDRTRGGWKGLNYLIDQGICTGGSHYFKLFLDSGLFSKPDFPSPEEGVAAIVGAGGIPVLAHPGGAIYRSRPEELLERFAKAGAIGVECYHPDHDPRMTEFCLDWCRRRQLLITGGSDCHGEFVKTRSLGRPQISLNQLQLGDLAG